MIIHDFLVIVSLSENEPESVLTLSTSKVKGITSGTISSYIELIDSIHPSGKTSLLFTILILFKIAIKNNYQQADMSLVYKSGKRYKFGQVNFNDFDLEPALLSSLVPFKTDQYYTTKAFHQLQQQLQATQYFSNVIAIPADKSSKTVDNNFLVPINVSLTPAKSHHFDFGFRF